MIVKQPSAKAAFINMI